jgi:hypothetical protein
MEEVIGGIFRVLLGILKIFAEVIIEILVWGLFDWFADGNPSNKKLEHRLKSLKNEVWFQDLYENRQYRHVIHADTEIRSYLGKKRNIRKLKQDETERADFIQKIKEEAVYFTSSRIE